MLDAYREGKLDRLFLVHAQFINTMTQRPRVLQLLPVADRGADGQRHCRRTGITSTSPRSTSMLDGLLMRYIESQVYQGAVRERRLGDGGTHGGDEERLG